MNNLYADNDNFAFLKDTFKNQDLFLQEINYFDKEKFIKLYNAVQTLREDHSGLKEMMFKLRRIIKATITMSTSLMIDEAISRIVEETCECLDCDRATTFIYDNMREELWSKAAKGSDATIRVPANKGIVGHVFTKGEAVNIYNAYADDRFNKAIDIKTGYKTNTILTVPIKDDSLKVIGVLQAVNKKETNTVFNKDDETLLTILSNLAGVVIRNSLMYNEQLSFHNVLRSALENGVALTTYHELNKLLPFAENKLKSLMAIDKSRIVLKFPHKSKLFTVLSDNTIQTYPMNCGIIGKVVTTGEHENVTNGYNDPLYNGIVDLESSLPLLCVPIKHPITEKVLGALEIINSKGIQGLSSLKRANVSPLDLQVLEFFSRNLARAILNAYDWERERAHAKGEIYFVDVEEKSRTSLSDGVEKLKSIDRLSKKNSQQIKKTTKKVDMNSSDSNTETSI